MNVPIVLVVISTTIHNVNTNELFYRVSTESSQRIGNISHIDVTASTALLKNSKQTNVSNFQTDCSDPHNNEIGCSVHVVDCSEKLFDDVTPGHEPPEAHDVRVEAFAKAMARKKHHQLHVDISWQISPHNNSIFLRAFKLQINDSDGIDGSRCFVFNVSDFGSTDLASPRFHFTSESLFKFSGEYRIALYSLPQSTQLSPVIVKQSKMPVDPEFNNNNHSGNISQYCKTHTNTEASKWTAAFRRIVLQSITRAIQIEFVGAPAHFCFEEYEVRLLDETGIELLRHAVIKAKDMRKEIIDGKTVYFGEYNFTGLEYGVDYIPSVIPVEMSSDGRCLCPTSEQHGACSCIAADWKRVRLQRIEKANPVINSTTPVIIRSRDESRYWPLYAIIIAFFLLFALCGTITVLLMFYRKYTKRGKPIRIRFISDHVKNSGVLTAEPRPALVYHHPTSILIVYSHDCPQHEAAVIALAELLRDSFQMDVHLDVWDLDIIERNLCDYVNSSIMKADKIIVINSVGSYYRLRARYLGEETIERVQKSPLDDLFLSQIDLVLQHANVISARFNYTPPAFTLFALSPLLQFMIPENLEFFIASLNESQLRNDPRLVGFDPQLANLHTAIATMTELIENEPKWFETTHYRVKRMTSRPKTPINASDRMSSQSAFVDRPFTNEPLIIHTRRSDVMNSSENNVVVAVRPLDDDVRPLLQESNELEFNEKQNDNVSPYSTFHSDIFVDKVPSKIQVNGNSSLSVRTHYDILQDDEVANEPIGRENDTTTDNDSGMVSDLTSGQLSV